MIRKNTQGEDEEKERSWSTLDIIEIARRWKRERRRGWYKNRETRGKNKRMNRQKNAKGRGGKRAIIKHFGQDRNCKEEDEEEEEVVQE